MLSTALSFLGSEPRAHLVELQRIQHLLALELELQILLATLLIRVLLVVVEQVCLLLLNGLRRVGLLLELLEGVPGGIVDEVRCNLGIPREVGEDDVEGLAEEFERSRETDLLLTLPLVFVV